MDSSEACEAVAGSDSTIGILSVSTQPAMHSKCQCPLLDLLLRCSDRNIHHPVLDTLMGRGECVT